MCLNSGNSVWVLKLESWNRSKDHSTTSLGTTLQRKYVDLDDYNEEVDKSRELEIDALEKTIGQGTGTSRFSHAALAKPMYVHPLPITFLM